MKQLVPLALTMLLTAGRAAAQTDYVPYRAAPPYVATATDSTLMEELSRRTFNWFWILADPSTGWIADRTGDSRPTNPVVSTAAVGFGLTAYGIGAERGYVTRADAAERTNRVLSALLAGRQGTQASGSLGYRGWYYHFVTPNERARAFGSELSSIDTGLLLLGVIFSRQYFDQPSAAEDSIRARAGRIIDRVDWPFMLNRSNNGVEAGWTPERGYIGFQYRGYSEAIFLYLLGLGAPINPLPEASWSYWRGGYVKGSTPWFAPNFVKFAPLFGHQYPQSWIDFRGLTSPELTDARLGPDYDYFENGRRATYASQAYAIQNPKGYANYGALEWGLTACDGPPNFGYNGYFARGAAGSPALDDGTIAPTAAAASVAYAPEIVLPTLARIKTVNRLYGPYGFRDAYNTTASWVDTDYLGIDQGPILLMLENYRSEMVWRMVRRDSQIVRGLRRAGFTGGYLAGPSAVGDEPAAPTTFALLPASPNPFNPQTAIGYQLSAVSTVKLQVFDALGRQVRTLVDETKPAGSYSATFDGAGLPSGIYLVRLTTPAGSRSQRLTLLR